MTYDVSDFLMHYGVKGMKWGVRRNYKDYQERALKETPGATKTRVVAKNGDVLSVEKGRVSPLSYAIAKATKRPPADNVSAMTIRDSNGKKVGSFQVWKDDPQTVRGEWLQIGKSSQGKGYSEAAIRGLMMAADKDPKVREVRLQVPSAAEPAKHIYGKLGFVKDIDLGEVPGYGNLEDWVYRVPKRR